MNIFTKFCLFKGSLPLSSYFCIWHTSIFWFSSRIEIIWRAVQISRQFFSVPGLNMTSRDSSVIGESVLYLSVTQTVMPDPLNYIGHSRMYNLVLTESTFDNPCVDWSFVDGSHYSGGFDIAINHNETMVSYPQLTQHGTTNPKYTAERRSDGLYNLKLPDPPQRMTTLFYLHQYMHEPGLHQFSIFYNS